MSYAHQVLTPGEQVRAKASLSWIPLLGSAISSFLVTILLLLVFGIVTAGSAAQPEMSFAGPCVLILLPFSFLPPIKVLIALLTTELALTDRRLIGKTGWISRSATEMLLTKVESVTVSQSLFGRMWGYGTILVRGSGGTVSGFPYISQAAYFRQQIAAQTDETQRARTAGSPSHPLRTVASDSGQSLAVFEVQIVDRQSGQERWVDVKAESLEHARQRAASTGEIVGTVRLKSIG